MKLKQNTIFSQLIAIAILCFSFAFFTVSPVFAIDDTTDDATDDAASPSEDIDGSTDDGSDEDLISSFKNPAQAAHAANLADAAASRGDEETADKLSDVESAAEGLEDAMATEDEDAIEEAKQALEEAEEAYAAAVEELTGVISQDLIDMRSAGMGWGTIAQELGVHPGVLGLGHTKGKQKHHAERYAGPRDGIGSIQPSEIAEATARNTRSGYAKGHGLAMNTGVDSQTSGLGFGGVSKSKGKSKGHGGASGLGSGQGQVGNSGDRGGSSNSGGNSSASSSPGNSGKSGNSSSTNRGGAGVAGVDGNPGGGNSGNSGNSNNGKGSSKDKGNNGKSDDRGNSKK